ncbi:hypothetical protein Sphch_1879 [Sphingobium chlorophenolicum L-1]|uniref:SnoaL-like domain-containing protein n=1 Tax=Sphingobium chlorophenolicum L-1 TaxID=690566 RepID=F6EUA8_SPHCR|nr:nuclear transport factor 2 family protein [Sphingobium chlorophenolicum]AEG49561.1 hypothetical protein Sphch_1879 [Sphingobium chlorophenolicum L-1]
MTDNKTLAVEEKLERLWATQDIKDLALRYGLAVDTRDWALMDSLWVETEAIHPDSVLNGGTILDVHVLRAAAADLSLVGASTMLVANHLVEFDSPDRAHGSVYCHCMMDAEVFFEQLIIYQDVYERHDGAWLFRTRDHLLWWGAERKDNPMRQPPAHWPQSQVGAGVAFETIQRPNSSISAKR